MAFKVFGPAGTGPDEYDDEAHHTINDQGVLVVYTHDRQITYGPAGWWRLDHPRTEGAWPLSV